MSQKRLEWLCAMLLVAGQAHAAIVADLVAHNGFEACWSQAITKATFLQLIQDSVNDRSFCIGKSSGSGPGLTYEVCNSNACPGNSVGCPVTTHAGAFSGDFVTGAFSATGSADDVTVPISYAVLGIPGNCTITISNIALDYAPAWFASADGNSGSYMAYLLQSPVSLAADPDVSVDPIDAACSSLLGLLQSTIITQAESAASDGWATQLAPATERESVCPLAP